MLQTSQKTQRFNARFLLVSSFKNFCCRLCCFERMGSVGDDGVACAGCSLAAVLSRGPRLVVGGADGTALERAGVSGFGANRVTSAKMEDANAAVQAARVRVCVRGGTRTGMLTFLTA